MQLWYLLVLSGSLKAGVSRPFDMADIGRAQEPALEELPEQLGDGLNDIQSKVRAYEQRYAVASKGKIR